MSGFELEMHVGSTLVDMYAKCSSFNDSLLTFNSMPSQHLAAWNAMIASCAQFEHNHEALELFQKIWQQGMEPNDASYVSLLKTCSTMASIDIGKLCHASCVETGDGNDIQVSSALVDMYSKCGSIEDAIDVFTGLPVRDIVTWNAMVSGYVKAGDEVQALQCFQDIRKECVKPDGVTFLSLLSACSRMRFRREGISMFLCMVQDKDIVATPEHYNCMVELLGSRGDWTEAHDLFSTMPASPNIVGWTSLLKQYGQNTDMTIKKRT
jgi:pentatricopeptide repeat protein